MKPLKIGKSGVAPALAAALLGVLAALGVWLSVWLAPGEFVERGDAARSVAKAPAQQPAAAEKNDAGKTADAIPGGTTSARDESPAPAACDVLLHRLPTITRAQCDGAALLKSGALSVQGVPLYWRDVPAAALPLDEALHPLRVLVVGAMHGDEMTAASLALRWIALAEQTRRPVHWRFIPVLNPDGLLARPATRVNARGVDLNRNFPTPGWAQDAPRYWEKRTRRDPRRWPGTAPVSEPESRFLHAQMAQFQPQLIVSIHAPYGVLDFDGPQAPPARLGRLWLDQVGIFPGSLGHYAGVHRGMPVVTIELPHALDMPREAEILAMWEDLLRWMGAHWPQVDAGPRP